MGFNSPDIQIVDVEAREQLQDLRLRLLELEKNPSVPPKTRNWAATASIIVAAITTIGAVIAAGINHQDVAAKNVQQARAAATQVVLDSSRSTSEAYYAGLAEGHRQAQLEALRAQPPPIKRLPDTITKKLP